MTTFDQDAVDEAVRLLQPQIDELKTQAAWRRPVKYVVHFDDGTTDTFDLVQVP